MSLFDLISDIFSPSVNIDGTPMIQSTGLDTHGNPFGVSNDWLNDTTSSMFDSFSSVSNDWLSDTTSSIFDSFSSSSMFDN